MKIISSYKVKIKDYNHIFKNSIAMYRKAVSFLIDVCLNEWDGISAINGIKKQKSYIETIIHKTKAHPNVKYDFDALFYKFPCYLLRAAIAEAIGKVSSYKSNYKKWEIHKNGKAPSIPRVGFDYPCLYKGNMFIRLDDYTAKIKVYRNNTWDWLEVKLRKTDVDYIKKYCGFRKECAPTLERRNKEWFLTFPFEEKVKLYKTDINEQIIAAVDLGINNACTISIMCSNGTILDRKFLKLSKEQDSLKHSINRIKKAQQHGNYKTPRLWARAKGINHNIAIKTAQFIIDIAVLYNVDTIVFEHLERKGKIKGSKKQKLHLWKSQTVQAVVTNKAHRLGMRISRVNAWGTSMLAYDGSGFVERGIDGNYSICRFQSGKIYNCDLSASYNIGARYFIREILKSLPVKSRLQLEAKAPQVCKRSTCTFSTLINLNAVLMSA